MSRLLIFILTVSGFIFAETNDVATAPVATAISSVNLFELVFIQGGIFMYVILLISMAMVFLMTYAFMNFRLKKLAPESFVTEIKGLLANKKFEDAQKLCVDANCTISRIIGAGLKVRNRGNLAMEEMLAEYSGREGSLMRTNVAYLNTIANISPMLGLLGTVSGMIKAFSNISLSGMDKSSALSKNISEALITTAGGLIVAIPAMAVFFYLRNKVNDLMVSIEDSVNEIIETIPE